MGYRMNERDLHALLDAQANDGATAVRRVGAAGISGVLVMVMLDARRDRADDDRCANGAPDRMTLARCAAGRAKRQKQNYDGFHKIPQSSSFESAVWAMRPTRLRRMRDRAPFPFSGD